MIFKINEILRLRIISKCSDNNESSILHLVVHCLEADTLNTFFFLEIIGEFLLDRTNIDLHFCVISIQNILIKIGNTPRPRVYTGNQGRLAKTSPEY